MSSRDDRKFKMIQEIQEEVRRSNFAQPTASWKNKDRAASPSSPTVRPPIAVMTSTHSSFNASLNSPGRNVSTQSPRGVVGSGGDKPFVFAAASDLPRGHSGKRIMDLHTSGEAARQCIQGGDNDSSLSPFVAIPRVRSFVAPPIPQENVTPVRRATPSQTRNVFQESDSIAGSSSASKTMLMPYSKWMEQRSMGRKGGYSPSNHNGSFDSSTLSVVVDDKKSSKKHFESSDSLKLAIAPQQPVESLSVGGTNATGPLLQSCNFTDSTLLRVRARRTGYEGEKEAGVVERPMTPTSAGKRTFMLPPSTTLLDTNKAATDPVSTPSKPNNGINCTNKPRDDPAMLSQQGAAVLSNVDRSLGQEGQTPRGRDPRPVSIRVTDGTPGYQPQPLKGHSPGRRPFAVGDNAIFGGQPSVLRIHTFSPAPAPNHNSNTPLSTTPRSRGKAHGTFSPSRRSSDNILSWPAN